MDPGIRFPAEDRAEMRQRLYAGNELNAVIGGVPTLAVRYENKIAARGGDNATAVSLSATLAAGGMTFSASGTLDALIVIL